MNKKVDKTLFDRQFAQVNASWGYEDAEIDEAGKKLIFMRLNGEISEEEFNEAVQKLAKSE